MTEVESQKDTTQALEVVKQPEKSSKSVKEEGGYTIETTTETKFKIIYKKGLSSIRLIRRK